MIKRITAFTSLLIAGIFLLALEVVPHHHHHDSQVCFVRHHCTGDDLAGDHAANNKGHSHEGETESDDCILKMPVVVPSLQWKTGLSIQYLTSDISAVDYYYSEAHSSFRNIDFPVLSPLIFEPSPVCFYSSIVSISSGLRAPPAV